MATLPAPQYRVPIGTDAEGRPVMADRPFFEYLDRLFTRVGGASAPTNSELVVDLHDDAGIEELKDEFFKTKSALSQAPVFDPQPIPQEPNARIEALEALVQKLVQELNDIRQGLTL